MGVQYGPCIGKHVAADERKSDFAVVGQRLRERKRIDCAGWHVDKASAVGNGKICGFGFCGARIRRV